MTKVYSLLDPSIVIYDSRVAAALGYAVALWANQRNRPTVPDELQFPWAPAKSGRQNRDPGLAIAVAHRGYAFPKLHPGPNHACANVYASWLMLDVAIQIGITPRQLEAALFMIGYDLPMAAGTTVAVQPSGSRTAPPKQPSPKRSAPLAASGLSWTQSHTRSKQNGFEWRLNGLQFELRSGASKLVISLHQVLDILTGLHGQFGINAFPLSNNMVTVAKGAAKPGLGPIFHAVTGRSAKWASHAAAMLEDLDIIKPVSLGRPLSWQLTIGVTHALNQGAATPTWLEGLCLDATDGE